jgi:hypothetical protein
MIAGVHLGLNFNDLAIARNAVRVDFDERVALAKDLNERIDLLRLQRAVKRHFAFGARLFDQSFLTLLAGQLVDFRQRGPRGFHAGSGRARDEQRGEPQAWKQKGELGHDIPP